MRKTTIALLLAAAFAPTALANPTGAQVVNGAALLSNPNASTLQIVNTPGTIINWQGFSIAAGETTRFIQLNAASAILNRVVTANPSSILGTLQSNGRVFLISPNGIVFGGGAVVDVAGLIASTRDISNANFLAGNFLFDGPGNGTITLQSGAQILTSTHGPGGQVWLIGRSIEQQAGSSITAPQGQVVLAAGSQLQVGSSSLGNMTFTLNVVGGETIELLGAIAAERGAVGLFADNIRVRGSGRVNVSAAATGNGGSISAQARTLLEIERLAELAADGGTASGIGGTITLGAADVRVSPVANAYGNVHASPRASGGQHGNVTVAQSASPSLTQIANVQLGGGPTSVPQVSLLADGSYVVVWADFDFATPNAARTIRAMRINANGSPIGGITIAATAASSSIPRVAALKEGGYAVVWHTHEVSDNSSLVKMVIVDPSGQTGPAITLSIPDDHARQPSIAALTNGGLVAAWRVQPGGNGAITKVLVQRFDASGSALSPARDLGINEGGPPRVAGLSDGGYRVFTGFVTGSGAATDTQTNLWRFDGGGQLVSSSAVAESSAGVSGLVGGGYALGLGRGGFSQPGSVQRFSATGAPVGGEIPFDAFNAQWGTALISVAGTADGGAIGVGGIFDSVAGTGDGGYAVAYNTPANNFSPHLRILARTSVASTPGAASGEAGVSVSFVTAPGATPEIVPAAPNPPGPGGSTPAPVVSGNPGGGATFAGFGVGTANAIYSHELQAAIALLGTQRAIDLWNTGLSGAEILAAAEQARNAVVALQASAEARKLDPQAQANENAVIARDHGEIQRLMGIAGARWTQMLEEKGAAASWDIANEQLIYDQVYKDWVDREELLQATGVYRSDPNEMSLIDMIQNMSLEERRTFLANVAGYMNTAD